MRRLLHLSLLIAVSVLSFPVGATEAPGDLDAPTLTISLPKPVHFNDPQGSDVVVPAGTYWVFPGEQDLMLVGGEAADIYTLAATAEESGEENPYPTATSLPNTEGEPDIHYVVFTSVSGNQLVAEGSYSGIRSRGWAGDKAKQAAAAARKRAQENARLQAAKRKVLENERLLEAARAAQSVVEQAKSFRQEEALERAQFLLLDIAETSQRYGLEPARQKLKTYVPELAVLIPIAIPPEQMLALTKQATLFISQNRGLIAEVLGRIADSPTIQQHMAADKGVTITPEEARQISIDIMGQGDNALQLPFVGTRGAGDFTGPSLSLGASIGGGVLGHASVGSARALSLTTGLGTSEASFAPMLCSVFSVDVTTGPVAELKGSFNVGFWQGAANRLGLNLTSGVWPDARALAMGLRVPVKFGVQVGGGASVTVKFALRNSETATKFIPKIAGFTVGPSAGAGGGASAGIGYSVTACPQELLSEEQPSSDGPNSTTG